MDRGLTNMRGRGETVSVGVGGPGLGLAIVYFFGGGRKSNRHFSSSTYVMCPTFVAWCIGRGVVLGCLVGLNATPRAENAATTATVNVCHVTALRAREPACTCPFDPNTPRVQVHLHVLHRHPVPCARRHRRCALTRSGPGPRLRRSAVVPWRPRRRTAALQSDPRRRAADRGRGPRSQQRRRRRRQSRRWTCRAPHSHRCPRWRPPHRQRQRSLCVCVCVCVCVLVFQKGR